jgi:hypothetical protein
MEALAELDFLLQQWFRGCLAEQAEEQEAESLQQTQSSKEEQAAGQMRLTSEVEQEELLVELQGEQALLTQAQHLGLWHQVLEVEAEDLKFQQMQEQEALADSLPQEEEEEEQPEQAVNLAQEEMEQTELH